MAIRFTCAECGKSLKVPDGSRGRRARCPACRAKLTIPDASFEDDPLPLDFDMDVAPQQARTATEAPGSHKAPQRGARTVGGGEQRLLKWSIGSAAAVLFVVVVVFVVVKNTQTKPELAVAQQSDGLQTPFRRGDAGGDDDRLADSSGARQGGAWGIVDPNGRMVYPPAPNPANPVNYIAWLNETFGGPIVDNAADDYLAAYELVESFEGDERDQEVFAAALTGPWSNDREISKWLDANREAMARFRDAAMKPECSYPLSVDGAGQSRDSASTIDDPRVDRMLMQVMLPHLKPHGTLARALIIEGWGAWQAGDQERLPDNALVVLRSAQHMMNGTMVIERLVGRARASAGYKVLIRAIDLSRDPDSLATRILPDLSSATAPPAPFHRYARLEQLCVWDICQRLYVPGERPGAWTLYELDFLEEHGRKLDKWFAKTGIGFDETLRELNVHYDGLYELFSTPYHQIGYKLEEWERGLEESKNVFVTTFVPDLSRARLLDERLQAERRATLLIVHLFAHHGEAGRFPVSLDRLRDPAITKLRVDPFSGRDFVYRQQGNSFILYSLADNLRDDGGEHDERWSDGDFVFWPVQDQ